MHRFRLNSPTLAVQYCDSGRGVAVLIPVGSEISTAVIPEANGHETASLVKVEWQEKVVSIFLVDLLERGEPLDFDAIPPSS
jgi:hypothetical protein